MIYPLGTTITHEITFMNKKGQPADIERLVQQVFLSSRHNQLGLNKEINVDTAHINTGVYEVDYQIPTDIDTDVHKQITFIFTAYIGTITKVATKTIQVDWK